MVLQFVTKNQIAVLGAALGVAVQDKSTFDRCDQMYRAAWRGNETFKASEFDIAELDSIIWQLKEQLAAASGIVKPEISFLSDDDSDWEFEAYCDAVGEIAVPAIKPDDLLVCLCNYKGEGEGWALLSSVAHLPVFRDKYASAVRFGL